MTPLKTRLLFFCNLLLILFPLTACTEINIIGKVLDKNGDTPLSGASVYLNNTTMGGYTNQQGDFFFKAVSMLNTELVISCPGYDLLVYKAAAEQVEGKRFVFKLHAKEPQQKNKMVLPDPVRKRWLDIFHQNFLGITKEASKSKIINERTIYFTQDDNKTGFMAHADTPLVVMNELLGYKISFNLVEFFFDEATGRVYLMGYTRYQELGDDKKWIKNRQRNYYGSTLHFYRSLITNQLYEEGFGTFLIKSVTDSSREKQLTDEQAQAAAGIVRAVPISAQQILYIDSTNNFSIRITGQLLVQYSDNPSSKKFLKRNIYIAGDLNKGIESYILFKSAPIGLNNAGVLSDPTRVEYSGYWMYEKAANLLPYDYQPD